MVPTERMKIVLADDANGAVRMRGLRHDTAILLQEQDLSGLRSHNTVLGQVSTTLKQSVTSAVSMGLYRFFNWS